MSAESPDQSAGWSCAREALKEIRAFPGELQTFVWGAFGELDRVADGFLTQELAKQQAQRQAERDALQGQIDRLASVAAELTRSVAEQKQLAGQRNRNGR